MMIEEFIANSPKADFTVKFKYSGIEGQTKKIQIKNIKYKNLISISKTKNNLKMKIEDYIANSPKADFTVRFKYSGIEGQTKNNDHLKLRFNMDLQDLIANLKKTGVKLSIQNTQIEDFMDQNKELQTVGQLFVYLVKTDQLDNADDINKMFQEVNARMKDDVKLNQEIINKVVEKINNTKTNATMNSSIVGVAGQSSLNYLFYQLFK